MRWNPAVDCSLVASFDFISVKLESHTLAEVWRNWVPDKPLARSAGRKTTACQSSAVQNTCHCTGYLLSPSSTVLIEAIYNLLELLQWKNLWSYLNNLTARPFHHSAHKGNIVLLSLCTIHADKLWSSKQFSRHNICQRTATKSPQGLIFHSKMWIKADNMCCSCQTRCKTRTQFRLLFPRCLVGVGLWWVWSCYEISSAIYLAGSEFCLLRYMT